MQEARPRLVPEINFDDTTELKKIERAMRRARGEGIPLPVPGAEVPVKK